MSNSLQTLKNIFDHVDIGLSVYRQEDPEDKTSYRGLYVNQAAADALVTPLADFVGKRAVETFPNIEATGVLDVYQQILATGEAMDLGEIDYSDHRLEPATYRVRVFPLDDDLVVTMFVNLTAEKRSQHILNQRNQALLAMSTPTIQVWQDILLLPLIGELDSARMQQMLEHLLHAIVAHQARIAIFDITGVPSIDTHVAQSLMQAVAAARMLGAEVILTGIRPAIAMTLVKLGIDVSTVQTFRSLHRGVAAAFDKLGFDIVRRPDSILEESLAADGTE